MPERSIYRSIISSVLREDINLSYGQWVDRVESSLAPFFDSIDGLIRNSHPNLGPRQLYSRKNDNPKSRARLARIRWAYASGHIDNKNPLRLYIQLGELNDEGQKHISWGIQWWGSSSASAAAYEFLKEASQGRKLTKGGMQHGVKGTIIRIILKEYTTDQIQDTRGDIADEILHDFNALIASIDSGSVSDLKPTTLAYTPTKDDLERAYNVAASHGQAVNIDVLFAIIEEDTRRKGLRLVENWRQIIEDRYLIQSNQAVSWNT